MTLQNDSQLGQRSWAVQEGLSSASCSGWQGGLSQEVFMADTLTAGRMSASVPKVWDGVPQHLPQSVTDSFKCNRNSFGDSHNF